MGKISGYANVLKSKLTDLFVVYYSILISLRYEKLEIIPFLQFGKIERW